MNEAPAPAAWWERAVLPAFGILVAAACVPYLVARHLPFNDYAGHLGAASIVAHFGDPAYRLAEHYGLDVRVLPYSFFHAFVWLASHVLPVRAAGQLYVMLFGAAGLPLAFLYLCASFRRDRALALLAVPLGFSHVVFYGFVDSVGGTTLALVALGLLERQCTRPRPVTEAALVIVAALTAMAHGLAFAWLLVCGLALATCHAPRPLLLARRMLWALPAIGLFALGLRNLQGLALTKTEHMRFPFPPFVGTHFGPLERFGALYRWLFDNYVDAPQEDFFGVTWLVTVAVIAGVAIWTWRRGRVAPPAVLALPAVAAASPAVPASPAVAAAARSGEETVSGAARWALLGAAALALGAAIAWPGGSAARPGLRWVLVCAAVLCVALVAMGRPRLRAAIHRHRVLVVFGVLFALYNILPLSLKGWYGVNIRLVVPVALFGVLLVPAGTLRGRRALLLAPLALAAVLYSGWVAYDFHAWDTGYMSGLDALVTRIPAGSRYSALHRLHAEHYRTKANIYDCGWVMVEKGGVCKQVLILPGASWVVLRGERYPGPDSGLATNWSCAKFGALYDYVLVSGEGVAPPFGCLPGGAGPPLGREGNWTLWAHPPAGP